ncbi:MAG: HI0074 family nucleotidyltransferase substrate-binding subunit [Deinococcota bacterium]
MTDLESFDISPLRRAVMRLEEGLSRYRQDERDTQIRDGLVQRFEFTYELAHKTLRRYLVSVAASPDSYAEASFAELIRAANARGLLQSEWAQWRTYRAMRAKTSHTYDEHVALEVVAIIPLFLGESQYLLTQLQQALGLELPPIDIQPEHWQLLQTILRRYVPDYTVWAFGSRVKGHAQPYADLDLALEVDGPLPAQQRAALEEALRESSLPWPVDVLDWLTTSADFKARIEAERVMLLARKS